MKRGLAARAAVVAAAAGGAIAAGIGVAGAAHADAVPPGYTYVTTYAHYEQCTYYGQLGVANGSWSAYYCVHGTSVPGRGDMPGALWVDEGASTPTPPPPTSTPLPPPPPPGTTYWLKEGVYQTPQDCLAAGAAGENAHEWSAYHCDVTILYVHV